MSTYKCYSVPPFPVCPSFEVIIRAEFALLVCVTCRLPSLFDPFSGHSAITDQLNFISARATSTCRRLHEMKELSLEYAKIARLKSSPAGENASFSITFLKLSSLGGLLAHLLYYIISTTPCRNCSSCSEQFLLFYCLQSALPFLFTGWLCRIVNV